MPDTPVLPVTLDRRSATPLAVQLAEQLRAAAGDGRLRSGDRLPSTRALAGELGVSRTVTAAAYEQLHAEGWIAGRHGSGTYVTTEPPGSLRPTAGPVRRDPADEKAVDLTPGSPWAGGIEQAAWRRAWRAASHVPPMVRPNRAGLPAYRSTVAEHLLRHRGLRVGTLSGQNGHEAILATSGTSNAAAELANAVLHPGDVVAVEEPGYQRAVGALRGAGLTVVPAPVDADGLMIDSVPANARAVYCSPAHQYPLGGRMSAARRVALVESARERGWLVIEDDYDGELRYDVAPLPLLAALAPDVVVHLGTTSKILTPTLGVGWMVAPPRVVTAILAHRDRTGSNPAPAGQLVVVEFARNGDLGRHLRRLRRELSERRSLVVDTLVRGGVRVLGDEAGAHVVVPVASSDAERELVRLALGRGLLLDGLARHHVGRARWFGIALGYAACSREELRDALPVLVELVRNGA